MFVIDINYCICVKIDLVLPKMQQFCVPELIVKMKKFEESDSDAEEPPAHAEVLEAVEAPVAPPTPAEVPERGGWSQVQ